MLLAVSNDLRTEALSLSAANLISLCVNRAGTHIPLAQCPTRRPPGCTHTLPPSYGSDGDITQQLGSETTAAAIRLHCSCISLSPSSPSPSFLSAFRPRTFLSCASRLLLWYGSSKTLRFSRKAIKAELSSLTTLRVACKASHAADSAVGLHRQGTACTNNITAQHGSRTCFPCASNLMREIESTRKSCGCGLHHTDSTMKFPGTTVYLEEAGVQPGEHWQPRAKDMHLETHSTHTRGYRQG